MQAKYSNGQFSEALEALRTNSLTEVTFSGMRIDNVMMQVLAKVLQDNNKITSLKFISYSMGDIDIGDGGIQALTNAMQSMTALKHFELMWSKINRTDEGGEGGKALAEFMKWSSSIETIDLHCTQVNDQGAEAIIESLAANDTLKELRLIGTNISEYCLAKMAVALKDNKLITVSEFYLPYEFNFILQQISNRDINLQKLTINKRISQEMAEKLGQVLLPNTTLIEIEFSGPVVIDSQKMVTIVKNLQNNSTIRVLKFISYGMGFIDIGGGGIQALASAMQSMTALKQLELMWSKINRTDEGGEGGKALAEFIKMNSSIETIDLHCTQINDQGAEAIIESLPANNSLKELKLSASNISDHLLEKISALLDCRYEKSQLSSNILEAKKIKVTSAHTKRSYIESKMLVSYDIWVISIVRKLDLDNIEHAFLVLEGMNKFGKPVLRYYELIKQDAKEEYAKIVIKDQDDIKIEAIDMINLTKNAIYYYQSWSITRSQAKQLHNNILRDITIANDPQQGIKNFIDGNEKFKEITSLEYEHNSFTWARKKLLELSDWFISHSIESQIKNCILIKERLYLPENRSQFKGTLKSLCFHSLWKNKVEELPDKHNKQIVSDELKEEYKAYQLHQGD